MLSPWMYNGKIVDQLPEECEAIVYLITNNINGMKYVGKKALTGRHKLEASCT